MRSSLKMSYPIFVVGNSRSGTTMMGRILKRNKFVYTFHEIHFFEELVSPESLSKPIDVEKAVVLISELISIERQGYLSKRTPEIYVEESRKLIKNNYKKDLTHAELFTCYLEYESARYGKRIPCDQTPRNLFFLNEIFEHFPDAKIINMIRDPRDVLLSQKNKWRRRFLGAKNIPLREAIRSWLNYHPFIVSKLWNSSISAFEEFRSHDSILNVYYEDLVFDTEEVVRQTCSFLDISYNNVMLQIPHIGSSSSIDEFNKMGIRQDRAFAWKKGGLSDTEIYICQSICEKLMNQHQYELIKIKKKWIRFSFYYILLPFQAALSFIVNIGRYKNLFDSLKRRFI